MKNIVEQNNYSDTAIEHGGFSFLIIRNMDSLLIEEIQNYSAVLVEAKNLEYVRIILTQIRSHNNPDVYLKPVFLVSRLRFKNEVLLELADGMINNFNEVNLIVPDVERILARVQDLTFTNSISFEAQMITKLITSMYVKERKQVNPIPYVYSDVNYYYPLLSVNFSQEEEHAVFDILKIAEEEGILRSDFYDRIYICNSCSSGHLSYREVCPKCTSSNTSTDDIIHHFPCGYVGPMADYANEIDDRLDCPKCNKRLRHIGVDYDKPSVIHTCKNCSHKFQDFHVNAKCLSCTNDKSVESLNSRIINSYKLTKKGELAAVKGFVTTTKDFDEVIGTIKYDTFKTMLKYEIERLKQTNGNSNICAINIANSSSVYSKLGSDLQKGLLKDLVSVIRSNIRTSDIISFESSSTIVLSMNDIPTKIANKILNEMVLILKDLIKSGFNNLEVAFDVRVAKIDSKISHETQLNDLIKDFA